MPPLLRLLLLLAGCVHPAAAGGFGRQAPVRPDHARIEALISDIVANMTVACATPHPTPGPVAVRSEV